MVCVCLRGTSTTPAILRDILHRLLKAACRRIYYSRSVTLIIPKGHRRPDFEPRHLLLTLRKQRARNLITMANDDILTDDYVAELLAKDAKESAIKYSSMGLDAFKQSKYVLPT